MSLSPIVLEDRLLGLPGLSERLLRSHFDNNYGGALRRLNALEAELAALDWPRAANFLINGLKREALVAHNSVVLHELYFDGLGGGGEPPAALSAALIRDFGSVARWQAEFVAMGKALGGGSGWVLLSHSRRQGRLVNQWAADHTCAIPDATPILALDMYEHAYHLDHGANAGAYVEAFVGAIHWRRVAASHALAVAEGLPAVTVAALRRGDRAVRIIDVRREKSFAADTAAIPGAMRGVPDDVEDWGPRLPKDRPVVVYCVHGHRVSQAVAAQLRQMGHDASYLAGGLAAWKQDGAPLAAGRPQ